MRVIGMITTVAAVAAGIGAVFAALANRKDIERYLKMRKM